MHLESAQKFVQAIESAGVKKYQLNTDLGTHYYNNDKAIILFDDNTESVVNIKSNITTTSVNAFNDKIQVQISDYGDIHEAILCGSKETIIDFMKAYGKELDKDQINILLEIENGNYNVMPITGDYLLSDFKILTEEAYSLLSDKSKEEYDGLLNLYVIREFKPATEEEIAKMSEKEKASYQKLLDLYKKNNSGLSKGVAAQINV